MEGIEKIVQALDNENNNFFRLNVDKHGGTSEIQTQQVNWNGWKSRSSQTTAVEEGCGKRREIQIPDGVSDERTVVW